MADKKDKKGKPVKELSKPRFKPGADKPEPDISLEADGFSIKGRLWISSADETFLGSGRVVLLERIREWGSITKAAASMGMAYRHAWRLVDSMNRQSPKPLVVSVTGGKNGGGATLTEEGEKAIKVFWSVQQRLRDFLVEVQKEVDTWALQTEKGDQ